MATNSDKRYCTAKTKEGKRCQAPVLAGKNKCLWHSTRYSRELAGKGGRAGTRNGELLASVDPPTNAAEVRDLLALQMIELRKGFLPATIASASSSMCNVYLKSTDMVDIQVRLSKMEALYAARQSK